MISCKDNNMSLKERILIGDELDNGVEVLTGSSEFVNIDPSSSLLTDLCDAYNAFSILHSVRSDMELFLRFGWEDALLPLEHKKCPNITNVSIRENILNYISNTYVSRNDTTGLLADEYNRLKSILIDHYRVENYGQISNDTYWNEYDENKRITDYDSIYSLRLRDANKAKEILEPLVSKETDFDKQCIYLKEYARAYYEYESRDENFNQLFLKLENQMNQGKYSIYLMEIWRIWRFYFQDGRSKDSSIYNKLYNEMRLKCCFTILNHIKVHPNDIMAINQFLVMSSIDNVYRYGSYPYGNQIVMEDFSLFPEYNYDEEN